MKKEYTLRELAELTGATLKGEDSLVITGASDLESALPTDASFLSNPRYLEAMRKSKAGVVCISGDYSHDKIRNYLVTDDPSKAFQTILEAFYGESNTLTGFKGIHKTAVIHPSATLDATVMIGPNAVIDEKVSIGSGTSIGAGCYIGPECVVGANCTIHPNVTIRERSIIGSRVIIQPGAVIGSCGFGLLTDSSGHHTKLNQVGNVVIEDDVEIGANTTIDRARFKSTHIKSGVKIDNLVQIAHKVSVGEHTIIVAQSGIAGSTDIGKGVIIASQVGIAGHLKIADGSILTARTGVSKSLNKPGQPYGGAPAMPLNEYNRNSVLLRNIERFITDVKEIKKKMLSQ